MADLDYYEVLGVSRDASSDEVKSAFRKLVKTHHPDSPGGTPLFFRIVEEAYETLGDPKRRSAYDRGERPPSDPDERQPSSSLPEVPPLVGFTLAQAKLMVGSLGRELAVEEIVVNTGDEFAGLVVAQDPAPGTQLQLGARVAVLWAREVTGTEVAAEVAHVTATRAKAWGKKANEYMAAKAREAEAREARQEQAEANERRAQEQARRDAAAADERADRHEEQLDAQRGQVRCASCYSKHNYYFFDGQVFGGRPAHPIARLACPSCGVESQMGRLTSAPDAYACPRCDLALLRGKRPVSAWTHDQRQRPIKERRRHQRRRLAQGAVVLVLLAGLAGGIYLLGGLLPSNEAEPSLTTTQQTQTAVFGVGVIPEPPDPEESEMFGTPPGFEDVLTAWEAGDESVAQRDGPARGFVPLVTEEVIRSLIAEETPQEARLEGCRGSSESVERLYPLAGFATLYCHVTTEPGNHEYVLYLNGGLSAGYVVMAATVAAE